MKKFLRAAIAAAVAATAVPTVFDVTPAAASTANIGVGIPGGTDGVDSYGSWLGREVKFASVYMPRTSWSAFSGSVAGTANRWKTEPYRVVWGFPLIVNGASLSSCANGSYDSYFKKAGQDLVSNGQSDAIIRLGWEFDGTWYNWSAKKDPTSYKKCFQRAVTAMRSVSGDAFKIDWNSGNEGTDPSPYYPGDSYVDIIGLDVYNQSFGPTLADTTRRWNDIYNRPGGLAWLKSFASSHGKPMSFPEWGQSQRHYSGVNPDDTNFIQKMYEFIRDNNFAYFNYFEHNTHEGYFGLMGSTKFPNSAKLFKSLFGKSSGSTSGETTTTTVKSATPTTAPSSSGTDPSLSINDVSVNESSTAATFTISLSKSTSKTVSFQLSRKTGTAGSADFIYRTSTDDLTIPAGKTSTTYRVGLYEDSIDEADETFTVVLSGAANATIARSTGKATIVDNDGASSKATIASSGAPVTLDDPAVTDPSVDEAPAEASPDTTVPAKEAPATTTPVKGGSTTTTSTTVAPTTTAPAAQERVAAGLQALYAFDEGDGAVVHDTSGLAPIDLAVADAGSTAWTSDGLSLDSSTTLRSTGSTARLAKAVAASDEVTVEAWITPASAGQDGPARVVSISAGTDQRNLLLGQGRWGDGPVEVWDARVRTDATTADGGAAVVTPEGSATDGLTHLVYTRAADGTTTVYVDGVAVSTELRPGQLDAWDPALALLLGNEADGSRPWLGTFHLVAIYARALSSAQVATNLAAGPSAG